MVKLGWMQDTHFRPPGDERTDAASIWKSNYNDLVNNKEISDLYFTGDLMHPASLGNIPHMPETAYARFWDTILPGTTDGGDSLKYAIPGNHDVPVQGFLKSDSRAVLRRRVDYDTAGVTVLLLNTQANSMVTGGAGPRGGIGTCVPRVPRSDLEWLDRQLNDAGTNAKLVLPHALLHPLDNANLFNGNIDVSGAGTYEFIENWDYCHNSILSNYNKVVVPQSHQYNVNSESSTTIDGVDYVRTIHYSNDADPASPDSYSYIDITDASVSVTSIAQDGTTSTNLSRTF